MLGSWPEWIVCLDCETASAPVPGDPGAETLSLRLAVLALCRVTSAGPVEYERAVCFDREDLLGRLEDWSARMRALTVLAHNAKFDCQIAGILAAVSTGRWRLEHRDGDCLAHGAPSVLMTLDSPPFLLRAWTGSGGSVLVLDTTNWFPAQLSELGEWLGLPKLKMPHQADADPAWIEYCGRDVEIVREAAGRWMRLCRQWGLKRLPWTLSQAAGDRWAAGHGRGGVRIPADADRKAMGRAAYYGGRSGAWTVGRVAEPVTGLDCQSLYGQVMRDCLLPVQWREEAEDWTDGAEWDPDDLLEYAALVDLDAAGHEYPVRRDGRVRYERGRLRTVLAGPELAEARRRNELVRVGPRHRHRLGRPLAGHARDCLAERAAAQRSGDPMSARMAKLMCNALSGKFGQRPPRWVYEGLESDDGPPDGCDSETIHDGGRVVRRRWLGLTRWSEGPADELRRSWPAVSAWITSWGRVRMDMLRGLAGETNVHLQLTDCLLVGDAGLASLQAAGEVGSAVGKLRVNRERGPCRIWSGTAYEHSGQLRVAGLRRDRHAAVPPARRRGESRWEQVRFEGLSSILRHAADSTVKVRRSVHRLSEGTLGGVVGADGRVRAFEGKDW